MSLASEIARTEFERYREAKLKAEASLSFADAHDAAQAWVRFQNCYLGPERQLLDAADPKGVA